MERRERHDLLPPTRPPPRSRPMHDALGSTQAVLLIGGSSEVGLAITRRLVERRAKTVVLAGRDPEALKTAADHLRAAGAETVDVVAFDALATDGHDAFVDDAFN